MDLAPRSLYVHLPFCRRRCFYCDFPIAVVGDRASTWEARTEAYLDVVLRELESLERGDLEPLVSCYVGGGTPSLGSAASIERLLAAVDRRFGLAADAEVTLEADPGTFDLAKIRAYAAAGVTRLSVGAQSFDDDELRAAGRAHDAAAAADAVQAARAAAEEGILRHGWSLDLISGLPGQTVASWRRTIDAAIDADPWHVSAYDLQIQHGTAFAKWYGAHRDVLFTGDDDDVVASQIGARATARPRPPLPTEDEAAEMYAVASSTLRDAGFDHYEISSYAKRRRSVHNARYWLPGGSWFAVGLGASSARADSTCAYPVARRFARPRTLHDYEAYVDSLDFLPGKPAAAAAAKVATKAAAAEDSESSSEDSESSSEPSPSAIVSVAEAVAEDVMTSLRTCEGLPLGRVRRFAGPRFVKAILRGADDAIQEGFAVVQRRDRQTSLRLTDPEGFLRSNAIIASIFNELLLD